MATFEHDRYQTKDFQYPQEAQLTFTVVSLVRSRNGTLIGKRPFRDQEPSSTRADRMVSEYPGHPLAVSPEQ